MVNQSEEAAAVEADTTSARYVSAMRPVAPGAAEGQARTLVCESPAMLALADRIARVAPMRASVLVTGERGAGKSVVAAAIHAESRRSAAPFVSVPGDAFTEALFERAHGGTLFLDDVDEMAPATQATLVRALRRRTTERDPGVAERARIDVRLIAATRADLRDAVRRGAFREDLYHRVAVVAIDVPPLRARTEDILPLAASFLGDATRESSASRVVRFSDKAQQRLVAAAWPGNVRELENVVVCAAACVGDGDVVEAEYLPALEPRPKEDVLRVGMTLAEIERRAILAAYETTGHSTTRTAQLLAISVRKVQYRLQQYGVLTARMESVRRSQHKR